MAKKIIKDEKTKAALSYIWIVGLIMLLVEKKNKFVKFHAKQGTVLFLITLIPFIGLIGVVGEIYGLIMALQGKKAKIPLVYDIGKWIADVLNVK